MAVSRIVIVVSWGRRHFWGNSFAIQEATHKVLTTPRDGNIYDVGGDLTIRGVIRHVVLPASFLGTAQDPSGNAKFVFEAELSLNRKDFGLNWNAALETGGFLVGDEVKVSLTIQAK